MNAVLALSPDPRGFTGSDVAKVRHLLHDDTNSPGKAASDLRKLRCKHLVSKLGRSRRYQAEPDGLQAMATLLVLRQKILRPLLAAASRSKPTPNPRRSTPLDLQYRAVQREMQNLFHTVGIAA